MLICTPLEASTVPEINLMIEAKKVLVQVSGIWINLNHADDVCKKNKYNTMDVFGNSCPKTTAQNLVPATASLLT